MSKFVKTAKTGKNRKPDEQAIQPFPIRPYVPILVKEWQNNRIMHIAKSRQMGMSRINPMHWPAASMPFSINPPCTMGFSIPSKSVSRVLSMVSSPAPHEPAAVSLRPPAEPVFRV
jgi:hypothetical protein